MPRRASCGRNSGNARSGSGGGAADLRPAPDPLLAALVGLLLPERDALLERVDRVLARGERVLTVRGGDRDHDARLADLDSPRAVMDGDLAEVVALLEFRGDLGHHLLRHLLVRLVVEVQHGMAAGLYACRA